MTTAQKCHLCDQTDHAFCGFCADCHDHTFFVRTCSRCEDACYPGEKCPDLHGFPHVPDESSEALSICCGASGHAYDDAPEPSDD